MPMILRPSYPIVFIIIITSLASYAQEKILDAKQIRTDLAFLKKNLSFPNELFLSPEDKLSFDRTLDSLTSGMSNIPDSISEAAFFRMVSKIVAKTQERHCKVLFPGTSFGPLNILDTKRLFFPLDLDFIAGHAVVKQNLSNDPRIRQGDILLSINQLQIYHIFEKLAPFVPSDGHMAHSKFIDLSKEFPYYYYYHIGTPDSFQLKIFREEEQLIYTCKIKALTELEMKSLENERYRNTENDRNIDHLFHLSFNEDLDCALLKVKTFYNKSYRQWKTNFTQLLQETFHEITEKGVNRLIIDVRNNSGGNLSSMFELLSYVMDETLTGKREKAITVSESIEGIPNAYLLPQVKHTPFKGELYILTNAGTFSAGSKFAALARYYACALIIGTETSSRYEGFMAGFFKKLTLPYSKLKISIPQKAFNIQLPTPKNKNRGLLPDIWIEPTLCDYLSHEDIQLNYIYQLMEEEEAKLAVKPLESW